MIERIVTMLGGRREEVTGLPQGVSVVRSDWIPEIGGRLCGMRGAAAAVTLGSTIVVHDAVTLTPGLLKHELEHVRQWRQRPITFPLIYIWHHFRHGYDANPFEVAARAAEHGRERN